MKKVIIKLFIVFTIIVQAPSNLFAQDVPPPPPGGHDQNGNTEGGGNGAPIGGDTWILLGLASGYAVKKVYDRKKKKLIE
jgi:hypothetical protein